MTRSRSRPFNQDSSSVIDQLIGDDAGIVFAVSDPGKRSFAELLRLADAEPHRIRPIWIEVIGAVAHAATIMP